MTIDKSALLDVISDILMDSDLLKNFAPTDVQSVARYFSISDMAEDAVIFREGDIGSFMCIVSSGKVSVLKSNRDGESVGIATLSTGRAFGEMAVLDGERRSATCLAASECELLILSKDSLDRMLLDMPAIAAKVVRAIAVSLSKRLRMADGKLVDRRTNCAF